MDFSVQRNIIMAGHAVLCNIERQLISVIQKFYAPVEASRCDRPVGSRLGRTDGSVHIFRFTVSALSHHIAVVNILSHEIKGLGNQLHILIRNLREIFRKLLKSLLRIFSKENRIVEPCHIPGPVIHWLIKAKQCLSRRFDILRLVRCRICHTAGRCISYLNRSARILSQIDDCLAVCPECVVSNLKYILIGKLLPRCMNP